MRFIDLSLGRKVVFCLFFYIRKIGFNLLDVYLIDYLDLIL